MLKTILVQFRLQLLVAGALLVPLSLHAQNGEVPRTRTLPGIESAAFPHAEPEEVGLSSKKLDQLGEEIVDWVANGDLVGAELLIVKNGRAVFHEAYGWSDREDRRPMERGSLFSIKSMSKPFAAMAILMLAEEGRLSLDDPVTDYISGYAGDRRTTVRHLLAHTSGYEGLGNTGGFATLEEWVRDWASRAPEKPFGEYSYSDFNYAALGYIVEAVSGTPVDSFIEGRIIRPLGLKETYTSIAPDAPWAAQANSRYAWNDDARDYDRYWSHRDAQGWAFYPAAWGLWATATDYAKFMTMWLNGGEYDGTRLLPEETVEEALRPHGLMDGRPMYGYGWFIEESQDGGTMPLVFEHGGFDGTLAMAFPADNAMVIYLTQSRGGGDAHWHALQNRLDMLGILSYPGPGMVLADQHDVAEVALSSEERARYIGTYRGEAPWAEGAPDVVARVWEEEGRMHVGVGEAGSRTEIRRHLVPLGSHRFAIGRYDGDHLAVFDPQATVRLVVEEGEAVAIESLFRDQIMFAAERIDPEELAVEIAAERSRVRIDHVVLEAMEGEGIEAARALHRDLLASRPDSVRRGESLLNALGYRLLREGRTEEAVAVLEMNVEAYPEEPNPYDSLGDAFQAAGRLDDARRRYARAVELAEEQGDDRLPTFRRNLERMAEEFSPAQPSLPAFEELDDGWNTLQPGGETMCAHGTEFEFYVRPGDPERVLVYLYGGGGCWDAEGCQQGSGVYISDIIPERHPEHMSGILDLHHPENPFADYSMVGVPVCTGDAHLGANDMVYVLTDSSGSETSFTVRHRGKTNVLSALDWISANVASPREIFVAGSSAGSLGVPFHGNLLAQRYPDARVAGLGDDSGSYGAETSAGVDAARWGIPEALRRHPGWEEFDVARGIEALNVTAGRSATNLELYQVDHAHDQAQYFYAERAGVEDPRVFRMLQDNRSAIREQLPDFRGYTIGGFRHTALQVPYFYRYAENGHRLRDWVAAIAAGPDVADISCVDCERSSFVYDDADLLIATRAIEILSDPDAWNSNDTGGSCAATPGQYSLRCVVSAAAAEVTGNQPGHHPFSWDVIFAAADRLGGERHSRAVVLYNNHPDTTADDIVALLEDVRTRIERQLGRASESVETH